MERKRERFSEFWFFMFIDVEALVLGDNYRIWYKCGLIRLLWEINFWVSASMDDILRSIN